MPTPEDVVREARPGRTVVGWKLDRAQRADLLERFPPRYEKTVADHVTLAAEVSGARPLPDTPQAQAVGHVDDDNGVEALVVSVAGTTDRPDGSTYHITWSLGPGRRAKESNDVLAVRTWQPLKEPIDLILTPERWP